MREGSSGRSSQSRHDGEKGERQKEMREARGVKECPSAGSRDWEWGRNRPRMFQCRQQGLEMVREGTWNVPAVSGMAKEGTLLTSDQNCLSNTSYNCIHSPLRNPSGVGIPKLSLILWEESCSLIELPITKAKPGFCLYQECCNDVWSGDWDRGDVV